MAQYGIIDGKATVEVRPRVRDNNGVDTAKGHPVELTVDELKGMIAPEQSAIVDLTIAPTKDDFNGLLAALRSAGIIAAA